MFLNQRDIVVVNKKLIKEYGAAGAIIVQTLNETYGNSCKIEIDKWCSANGIFWYMDSRVVRITINRLVKQDLISIIGDTIVLSSNGITSTKEYKATALVSIAEEKTSPKKKVGNEIYDMAKFLVIEIFKYNPELITPKSQLRTAKKLLDQGVTIDEIKTLYGENSWWYKHHWKGQKGSSPKPRDIFETLEDARANKTGEVNAIDDYWA